MDSKAEKNDIISITDFKADRDKLKNKITELVQEFNNKYSCCAQATIESKIIPCMLGKSSKPEHYKMKKYYEARCDIITVLDADRNNEPFDVPKSFNGSCWDELVNSMPTIKLK